MTIERVKINWGPNEELRADQINAVDTNATYALDKRQGETDTLSSSIVVDGYADITYQAGSVVTHKADTNEIYELDSALYLHGLTDFDGFSAHNDGDVVSHYSGSLINHLSGSVDHYSSGAIMVNDGYGEFADLRLSGTSKVNYKTPRSYTRKFLPVGDRLSEQKNILPGVINLEVIALGANFTLDLGGSGIPNGSTITKVKCYYQPALGHSFLPAQMPELKFYRSPLTTIAATILQTVYLLGIPDVATYEVYQSIDTPTMSVVLDLDNYAYSVWFTTESGLNSDPGTIVFGFEVTFTTSHMNDY